MSEYSVVIFYSNNHVMWAVKLLKKAGIECRMMPIPRNMSSDCGYCARIKNEDTAQTREILASNKIEFRGIEVLA